MIRTAWIAVAAVVATSVALAAVFQLRRSDTDFQKSPEAPVKLVLGIPWIPSLEMGSQFGTNLGTAAAARFPPVESGPGYMGFTAESAKIPYMWRPLPGSYSSIRPHFELPFSGNFLLNAWFLLEINCWGPSAACMAQLLRISQCNELCRSRSPQLLLTDVGLPDANGIDLTAQVKEMLPETAVIIVSQHAGHAYVEQARAAGAFAYITKAKVYRELLPTVGRALGRAPSGSGHRDPQ